MGVVPSNRTIAVYGVSFATADSPSLFMGAIPPIVPFALMDCSVVCMDGGSGLLDALETSSLRTPLCALLDALGPHAALQWWEENDSCVYQSSAYP
jgi:hypothetical protein